MKKGSPLDMPPPPGMRACTLAANSVVDVHMLSGLKLADTAGNAGPKKANSLPDRCASVAARMSSSASPLGSMMMTVPGPRMASERITSRSRVLPLLVVPPMST